MRPGVRHLGRELALKTLFQLESSDDDSGEVLAYHAEEEEAPAAAVQFAEQLISGVTANRERLDEVISQTSEHWRLDQMAKVERVILRIAIFEIALQREVPEKAAINEAIELAKTFSGDEAGRFVNGILGKVAAGA